MGKLPRSIFVIALAIWTTGPQAYAVLISVDADVYTPGTDISTVFDSVKLQTYYDNGQLIGKVYSRQVYDPILASTGTNVFGHAVTGTDAYGRPRNETWVFPQTLLVIEFYEPAGWVSFDIIGDNTDGTRERAAVDVYDADLNLIEWAQTPLLGYAELAPISINRDTFDISFIVTSGTDGAVYIDNLQANIIPEPATLLLLGLGGIFISLKHKAQARILRGGVR
ncbi:MAG: PEP-CTERM sorting domain-containing protein [Planctomycetota bacterium]|jgi:hypothetical protein